MPWVRQARRWTDRWHAGGRAPVPGHALGLALIVGASLAACASPEATRTRQGGPGGDIGNRGARVEIHGRTDPSYDVPSVGQGIQKAGPDPQTGRNLRSERNAGR